MAHLILVFLKKVTWWMAWNRGVMMGTIFQTMGVLPLVVRMRRSSRRLPTDQLRFVATARLMAEKFVIAACGMVRHAKRRQANSAHTARQIAKTCSLHPVRIVVMAW